MKTLNRALIVTVASVLTFTFLGLFLISKFDFFEHDSVVSIRSDRLKVYIEVLFAALCVLAIFLIARYIINKTTNIHKQYYDLFEKNPTPMVIIEKLTHKFLAVNKASVACYGYSAEEFFSLKLADIWLENGNGVQAQNGKPGDYGFKDDGIRHHLKKNGEIITMEISSSEVVFKTKNCRLFVARDITEIVKAREDKKIAEEENLNQKKFTSYVLENFPVDVAIFDKDHRYILINKVAVKNNEIRKWMIGKDDFDYFKLKGLDDSIPKHRREKFNKAVAGESTEWIDEHCINGEMRYILRKFFPYREHGELKYVYGYGMDITDVRKAQMQKDEYLKQLEKIAFATSHKIRQPICNIQGLIALLEDERFDSNDSKKIIACMNSSSQVLDDLTRELAIKLHEYKQLLSATQDG